MLAAYTGVPYEGLDFLDDSDMQGVPNALVLGLLGNCCSDVNCAPCLGFGEGILTPGLRGGIADACHDEGGDKGGDGCNRWGKSRLCTARADVLDGAVCRRSCLRLLVLPMAPITGGKGKDSVSVISLCVPHSLLQGIRGLSSTACWPGRAHVAPVDAGRCAGYALPGRGGLVCSFCDARFSALRQCELYCLGDSSLVLRSLSCACGPECAAAPSVRSAWIQCSTESSALLIGDRGLPGGVGPSVKVCWGMREAAGGLG